jgi:hypothetical protein
VEKNGIVTDCKGIEKLRIKKEGSISYQQKNLQMRNKIKK